MLRSYFKKSTWRLATHRVKAHRARVPKSEPGTPKTRLLHILRLNYTVLFYELSSCAYV